MLRKGSFLLIALTPWTGDADALQVNGSSRDEIVVTGRREKPPRRPKDSYDTHSINSLNASTVGEIINKLERRLGGRPFSIVVNGRRLTNISDINELPSEALQQVDILDRAQAGAYGLTPQNDVLNLTFKPKFVSASGETRIKQPTEGSATSASAALRSAKIIKEQRFNAALSIQNTDALIAANRQSLFSTGQRDPLLNYRSLLPSSRSVTLTGGMTVPIGSISTSLSGSASVVTSRQTTRFFRYDGKAVSAGEASKVRGIIDESRNQSYQFGATVYGNLGRASWALELGANILERRNASLVSERIVDVVDSAVVHSLPILLEPLNIRSSFTNLTAGLSGNAALVSLPAGQITGNFRLSGTTQRLRASSGTKDVGTGDSDQSRSQHHIGVDIPLTNSTRSIIGRTALTVNGDYEHVSGVGGLPGYDLTFLWQPAAWVSFNAGRAVTKTRPPLGNSQEPTIVTPGVLVADALTGEYILVTRISGRAPGLRFSTMSEQSLRLTLNSTIRRVQISATIEHLASNVASPLIVSAYPTLLFQRLFPTRFARDSAGRLTTIDARPFNGEEERRNVLRPNLHATGALAGENGTWDLSAAHEWILSDTLVVEPGGKPINLLATPLDGVQGTTRHRLTIDLAMSYKRLNVQLGGRWRAAADSAAVASDAPDRVQYGALWTVDGEMSFNFRIGRSGRENAEKTLRLWLSVENVFNRRQRVNDGSGQVPVAFQKAFLDPLGRSITLRLSRTF
ncbi:MAG: TonB-dependent receptor [Sphingomonas phyllosphaerae]